MKYNSSNAPTKCMMTNSTCYKGTRTMTVKGVLWHSTGANNPSLKRYVQPSSGDANYSNLMNLLGKNTNGNDWNHIYRQAGVNAWIGKTAAGEVTTIQSMPWNYRPWGCGSGTKGTCNDGWIQFEICEDALTDKTYFNKVYKEACELTAYLCKLYNINPKGKVTHNGVSVPTILCHYDSYHLKLGSNHGDVYNWFNKHGKTMDDVRSDVYKLLNATTVVEPVKAETTVSSNKVEILKGTIKIAHASIDERSKISGGSAGDQTGKEVCTRNWYSKPWNVMLRYKDPEVSKKAAAIAKKLANSNLVGYDQGQRNTLYQKLKKYNFDVDKYIASKEKSETDCSAFVYACYSCVIKGMRSDSNAPTTSTMKSKYKDWGFTVYTDDVHVKKDSALATGDVLVKSGSHTVMVIGNSGSTTTTSTTSTTVPYIIKVNTEVLNVRKGPSTTYAIVTTIKQGDAYTIVEESNGWGKLKSGIGWISLAYTVKKG